MSEKRYEHAATLMKSIYGDSLLHCYSFGPHEEDNLLCVQSGDFRSSGLVRVQSACYTAEIFRSTDCDCHEQLDASLRRIHEEGGLLVYMLTDGRGAGLLTKVRGLDLYETRGLDTYDAYVMLGVEPDPRSYDRVVEVLQSLEVERIRLLTNNPRKLAGVQGVGVAVEHVPLQIAATAESETYLRTKREKFGHLI